MPPIAGRVLGWLMICEPAEQSAAEIASAIGASRASLTNSLRLVMAAGFVVKQGRAGGRTAYYRINDDAWGANGPRTGRVDRDVSNHRPGRYRLGWRGVTSGQRPSLGGGRVWVDGRRIQERAAAISLQRIGWDVTVLERSEQPGDAGAGLSRLRHPN